jgi:hypothetical protein
VLSFTRVSTDVGKNQEMMQGAISSVENERKVVFLNGGRATDWITYLRNAMVASKTADKMEYTDIEYGWKHRLVRGTIFSACLLGETSLIMKLIHDDPERVNAS